MTDNTPFNHLNESYISELASQTNILKQIFQQKDNISIYIKTITKTKCRKRHQIVKARDYMAVMTVIIVQE